MAQLFIDNSLQYKILRTSITGLSDFLFRFKMYRLHYVVGGLTEGGIIPRATARRAQSAKRPLIMIDLQN